MKIAPPEREPLSLQRSRAGLYFIKYALYHKSCAPSPWTTSVGPIVHSNARWSHRASDYLYPNKNPKPGPPRLFTESHSHTCSSNSNTSTPLYRCQPLQPCPLLSSALRPPLMSVPACVGEGANRRQATWWVDIVEVWVLVPVGFKVSNSWQGRCLISWIVKWILRNGKRRDVWCSALFMPDWRLEFALGLVLMNKKFILFYFLFFS